jgi:hypothetical protein
MIDKPHMSLIKRFMLLGLEVGVCVSVWIFKHVCSLLPEHREILLEPHHPFRSRAWKTRCRYGFLTMTRPLIHIDVEAHIRVTRYINIHYQ